MKKLYVMIFFIIPLCLTCCELETPKPLVQLDTSKIIRVIPASFVKVYETSFENVNIRNAQELEWDFPHTFEYTARHQEDGGSGSGLGGADMWIDTARARTGNKSIGLEVFDIERSRRSELVIFPKNYVGKEYFISYWLYLPGWWGLFDPTIDWDWFEIGNPYVSKGLPYSAIHISHPDEDQAYYSVSLSTRDEQGVMAATPAKRLLLPKERWFQICYYVKRDKTDGAVKIWFDGQLIADKSGFPTASSLHDDFTVSIAKIYHERGDREVHQLWIDDLEIYTKKP